MRTTQRDQGGTSHGAATVADAPSGGGVFLPAGVPYTFVRSATGQYDYKFDARLTPRGIVATAGPVSAIARTQAAAGSFTVQVFTSAGAAVNDQHQVSFDALDKRT